MTGAPGSPPPPPMLDPNLLLGAYSIGVFPMADHRDADSVYWVEPKQRAVLPLAGFHLSRSLRKALVSDRFRVTADTAFAAVIALCAESAADREETWINRQIEASFLLLHRLGYAHSVECWDGERLVGGLYGLALGRAFFGESMVSRASDASKIALAWLVARLRVGGYTLLDCQFQTDHLAALGAVKIDREDYMVLLAAALEGVSGAPWGAAGVGADFGALDGFGAGAGPALPADTELGPPSGKVIAQLLGQTS